MLSENAKALISGASAGAIGFTTTLPIDYIKQHIQTNKTMSQIFRDVQTNGSKILFRGGLIGLSSIAPQMAIKYFAFHNFNSLMDDALHLKPISAFGAGLVDGAFLGPILAMQAFRQMNVNNKKIDYLNIVRNNFGSLMVPMALRNATYTSGILGGYFIVKKYTHGDKQTSFLDNFLIGSVLNIPATIFCSPFDVLRAKHTHHLLTYYSNMPYNYERHKTLGEVWKEILMKDGLRGLYRGYSSLYINFAIRFPLTLALQFEILKLLSSSYRPAIAQLSP